MEYGSFNNLHTNLSNGNKIGRFSYAAGIGYPDFGRMIFAGVQIKFLKKQSKE